MAALIDLTRHNLVEASAGTGKTYTIEQLLVRLLVERHIELERILVVTFTEKATGELKTRLRRRLEIALGEHPAERPFLQGCLDGFDQAPISTIHAFCHNLLREFPFEQGQEFALELVDRDELLRPALREVQRTLWPQWFGDSLADLLVAAPYNRAAAEKWEQGLLGVAAQFRSGCEHRLRPEPAAPPPPGDLGQAGLAVRTVHALRQHVASVQERRGVFTFDDMIERVGRALDRAGNRAADLLLERLRQRYDCAIVDEFQDTDPLQWSILRRIFVEGGKGRIFLVGDPKQAIFAFRGADLPTYLTARSELSENFDAAVIPLDVNWRSCPDLLVALNRLFAASGWFIPSGPEDRGQRTENRGEGDVGLAPVRRTGAVTEDGQQTESGEPDTPDAAALPPDMATMAALLSGADAIHYRPVQPPPPGQARYVIKHDATGVSAVNLVDLRDLRRLKGDALHENARFVAAEIARLLSDPALFRFSSHEGLRSLRPSDVAILVSKRPEADPLIQALRQRGIPFTFYKAFGLWRSPEALQIGYALEALARPDDRRFFRRLLLTRFFRLPPQDLVAQEDLPDHHPARVLFLQWLEYVEQGAWAQLCASLVEDSAILSLKGDEDLDRPLANLRHILGALEQAAYRDNLDIHGLLSAFRRQQQAPNGRDADVEPIASERPKVQILTVHASKGLEFPIVFLAGGFTTRFLTDVLEYRDGPARVFHFGRSDAADELHKAERRREDRRLLYVALTRAMFKLYLPCVVAEQEMKRRITNPGPLSTLLRPALDAARLEELGAPIAEIIKPETRAGLSPLSPAAGERGRGEGVRASPAGQPKLSVEGPLFPSLDRNLARRRIALSSYSSLRRRKPIEQDVLFGDAADRLDDDEPDALDEPDPLRGAEFGDLVHRVLEKIDWQEVAAASSAEELWTEGAAARRLLDREIGHTLPALVSRLPAQSLEAACRAQVGRLVWLGLTTPLPPLGGPLCRLPKADCLREVEFLFPQHGNGGGVGDGNRPSKGQRIEEGFLTGFIDLVVRKDERYFLLDWKTNLLEAYDAAALQAAMEEADYTRQYRLYALALARWLARVRGDGFDFARHLGGVFYVFLRGLNGKDDAAGVFFAQPESSELSLEQVLAK